MRKLCIALLALVIAGPTLAQQVTQGVPGAGQLPGTATNDSANAGNVGEYVAIGSSAQSSASVTISINSPAVITWTAHPIVAVGTGCLAIVFTTTGALPTGIVSGTIYYVLSSSITANTFQIATSCDNAIAGTAINTSGTQSGTQSGTLPVGLTSATVTNIAGIRLSAGDWDLDCTTIRTLGGTTVVTFLNSQISNTSGAAENFPGTSVLQSRAMELLQVGPRRVSIASAATYYCFAFDLFATSTDSAAASIFRARRVR